MDPNQQQVVTSTQSAPDSAIPQGSKDIPVWLVILLLLVFPPAALFIIFREKYYHSWVPVLLWLFAVSDLLVFSIMRIFVTPQLELLYKSLNVPNSISIINLIIVLFIILLLVQIIFGIILFKKYRLIGYLSKSLLITSLLFLVTDFISPAFFIIGVIKSIYSLSASIGNSTVQKTIQYSPSSIPDPTANWKIYTNSQYNFVFKYPGNFTLLNQSEDYIPPYDLDTPLILARKAGLVNAKAQYMQDVSFSVSKSSDLSKCYMDENDQKITEKQTINATEYYVTLVRGAGAGHSIGGKRYRVIKNNVCFEVAAVNETEIGSGEGLFDNPLKEQVNQDMQNLQSELDQILSTFKFTDQAINKTLVSARDTQRKADIEALFISLKEYGTDNQGRIPDGITEKTQFIKTSQADICHDFVPKYFPIFPHDPSLSIVGGIDNCNTVYDSGYAIAKDTSGKITISAPHAESETISITKDIME